MYAATRLTGKSSFPMCKLCWGIFFGVTREQCYKGVPLNVLAVSSSIFLSRTAYVRPLGPLKAPRTIKSADLVRFWRKDRYMGRASKRTILRYIATHACNFSHARWRNPSVQWKMIGFMQDKVFMRCSLYRVFRYWIHLDNGTASRMRHELALFFTEDLFWSEI